MLCQSRILPLDLVIISFGRGWREKFIIVARIVSFFPVSSCEARLASRPFTEYCHEPKCVGFQFRSPNFYCTNETPFIDSSRSALQPAPTLACTGFPASHTGSHWFIGLSHWFHWFIGLSHYWWRAVRGQGTIGRRRRPGGLRWGVGGSAIRGCCWFSSCVLYGEQLCPVWRW